MKRADYTLILLSGGKSRRMGRDKAQLSYAGVTFVEAGLQKARYLGLERVLLSGCEAQGAETVWDVYPGAGPLAGIHAGLCRMQTPYALVLPVDVPQLPPAALEALLEEHGRCAGREEKPLPLLLRHGERRENLIGIYPREMKDYIEENLRLAQCSVHGVLDGWGCRCLDLALPVWQAQNINTPEDYETLLQAEREG